jgi:hypothetical protein
MDIRTFLLENKSKSLPRRFGNFVTLSTFWELFSGDRELFKGL